MSVLIRIIGTFAVRAVSAFSGLAVAALVTNIYSLGKFGEFAFALMTVKAIGAFAIFSLDSLLLRTLLRRETRRDSKLELRLIKECSGIADAISFMVTLFTASISIICFVFSSQPDFWLAMFLLSPIIIAQNTAANQATLLRNSRRDAESQLVALGIPAILTAVILAFAIPLSSPPELLPEIASIVAAFSAVAYGTILTKLVPFRHLQFGFARLRQKRFRVLGYSGAVHTANVMNIISSWYGPALLSVTSTFEVVGIFRVLQQVAQAFHLISISVEVPFSTEIAKAHLARDIAGLRKLLCQSQYVIGFGGLVIAAVLAATPSWVYQLFGIDMTVHFATFFLLVALLVLRLFAGASQSALNLMDSAPSLIRASAWSLALAAVMQTALIPFFGLTGATVALGAQHLLVGWTAYFFLREDLKKRDEVYRQRTWT